MGMIRLQTVITAGGNYDPALRGLAPRSLSVGMDTLWVEMLQSTNASV